MPAGVRARRPLDRGGGRAALPGVGELEESESARAGGPRLLGSQRRGGIDWLVSRLRDEVQVEAIHAASSLLARLGEAAIGPAIEELANDPTPDQALALLNALGSHSAAESRPTLEVLRPNWCSPISSSTTTPTSARPPPRQSLAPA